MILILSFEDNAHAESVRRHLTRPSVVYDVSWFPASSTLEARYAGGACGLRLSVPQGGAIDFATVGAIWNRRQRPLTLHPQIADDTSRLFAWSESNEALLGALYSLDCYWMNPPAGDEVGQRKVRQLQVAQQVGLSVPDTLITNQPEVARDFLESRPWGATVRKAFRNIPQAPRETRLVKREDLAMIDSVRFAPVIFQAYVPVDIDLRVTIVDGSVFAASIASEPQYHADYRTGLASADVRAFELPSAIADALLSLMERLNLQYGAIDLRRTPDGEYVFFEVNPGGEFLFVSERTGLQIPRAIAAALERHHRTGG